MSSIELTAPRTITINDRGRQFSLKLARITKKQWLRYFAGIVSVSENVDGQRVNRFDATGALLELLQSALIDAAGYVTADNSPVTATSDWRKLLPLAHRLAASEQLIAVERGNAPEDAPFVLGFENVYLNAVWGADDKGVMQKFSGLCHRFKTPTEEHQAKLSRAASRSVIVGGSRRGTTRWMAAQPTLAELYDELILSVEGYAVNGQELGDDHDAIVAEMDTFHKVAAADVLFSPADVLDPDAAEDK